VAVAGTRQGRAATGGGWAGGGQDRGRSMSGEIVLDVKGVSKRFGGLQALSDVGIRIQKGQVYGLIGPNGAGKTTFFNVITGLYTPDSGSFDLGGATVGEPTAILIQEALGAIGIKLQINKIPGATWRAALLKKDMPMIINRFGGWLDYPEYFFFWCYHGQNAVFNTMGYQNPKLDKLITNARFAESKPIYDSTVREMIQLAYDEVPRIPLMQPTMDVAMQKDVQGYQYWFHLQPDYRQLFKA
jgi:ABC-type transport system substrate-binding protein